MWYYSHIATVSKGFLASKSKPISIPFIRRAVLFKSGEGNIQYSTYER